MGTHSRWDQVAGAVLIVVGGFLLGLLVVGFTPALANLGSADGHLAGDALMTTIFLGPPFAIALVFTLYCAWLLWRGSRNARVLAVIWAVGAGLFVGQALSSGVNSLWALRTSIAEPGSLSVGWPTLSYTYDAGAPSMDVSLADPFFWLPAVVAIAAIAVAGCLLAGWVADGVARSSVRGTGVVGGGP